MKILLKNCDLHTPKYIGIMKKTFRIYNKIL